MPEPAALLVVHRDPSVHKIVREALAGEEWRIDSAHDTAEAVSRLQSAPYDLVLAGMSFPGEDCVPLVSRVREMQPAAKIVLTSGGAEPAQIMRLLRAGVTCCVREPLSPVTLKQSLATVLAWHIGADDIEILSDRPDWISLRARAKIETAERLSHFFLQLIGDLDNATCDAMVTAVRELLINAIEHGAALDADKRIDVTYVRGKRSLLYYIRDPGEGFSFEDLPHAAISNPEAPLEHVELREQMGSRPGGFGILLTRNFADELLYSSKGNEVLLIRYL